MSRGHGRIQDFIVEQVVPTSDDERDIAIPIPLLAVRYANRYGIDDTRHLRASIRRAANRLATDGAIQLGNVLVPTRTLIDGQPSAYRWILVVAPPGTEWSPDHDSAAQRMMRSLTPETVDSKESR